MILMLDCNIIIDHIARREPFYQDSRSVCLLGLEGKAELFISTNTLTDIHYVLRRDFGSIKAQEMIEENLSFLNFVGVSPEDAKIALSRRWNDFEDCLVARCAEKINADFIVTRDSNGFKESLVPTITPKQLLTMCSDGETEEEPSSLF